MLIALAVIVALTAVVVAIAVSIKRANAREEQEWWRRYVRDYPHGIDSDSKDR